jgi:glycosyltransferase involved in cell wall biosynthesis
MLYFILDNIYNKDVNNGVFFRYKNFIHWLLDNNKPVTLITRNVKNVTYPKNLNVVYIPFIKIIVYSELYVPILITVLNIIPKNSTVITLLEYTTANILTISKKFNLILGYHTNLKLYVENYFFLKLLYNVHNRFIYTTNPILVLISGYSSYSIFKTIKKEKVICWYDMNSSFLEYPIIKFNYDKEKEINMIYTGRISNSQKNINTLIDIVYEYNKKYGKARLTLYGDGPDFNKYMNSNLIHFYGSIDNNKLYYEYEKYINKNPVFIFASTTETLGKSPIEASLCGLPVFTAISPETLFIYKDGINGFTFSSVNECCNKINNFINLSECEKKNIIKNGKMLKKKFDSNIYSKIYDKITKNKKK